MSEPEVKFEIDEHGRIGYRVTNEGLLLSKDEKEFIIDHIARMQEESAKLRELVRDMWRGMCGYGHNCLACEHYLPRDVAPSECEFFTRIHELGIEVTA